MARVACVMMQKDEVHLLEPWLSYHGYLFGYENLYVLDNGSTRPEVLLTLARYAGKGVNVDYSPSRRDHYLNKGAVVGALIHRLEVAARYDFFLPTDCDEFVLKQTAWGFTTDRQAIHAHLETLKEEPRTLRIPFQLANHPLMPDLYSYFTFTKTFYAAGAFGWTDHGHHTYGSRKAAGFRDTDIVHAHFHHMPFDLLLQAARRKWNGSVSPDDKEKLVNYTGDSMHLAPYFLMTAADYYAQFNDKVHFYLPQLRARLNDLGTPLELPRETMSLDICPDTGDAARTTLFVPKELNAEQYLDANGDVRGAGLNGIYHFTTYGFREVRRLVPSDMLKGLES
jgi:hypothetical protein